MDVIFILAISVLLQLTAAFLAFRLIRVTGSRIAWILIATAISFMALRRCIPLFRLISGDFSYMPDLTNELVGLAISALMVVGIALIEPMFLSIKRSEKAVIISEKRYRSLIETAKDVIFTVSVDGTLTSLNSAFEKITGWSSDKWLDKPFALIIHLDDLPFALQMFQQSLSGKISPAYELRICSKSGEYLVCELSTTPQIEDGKVVGILGIARDVTDRKRMEEKLRALSFLDELTGLFNQRGFFTLAEQQLKLANRTRGKMFLLFADIDDFKWINDNVGHHEGDLALIETANILKETSRESDIVARIGGDEFVVIALETEKTGAEILRNRLQEKLKDHNARGDLRYKLSISTGISHYDPEHPCSIDELLSQADKLMYEQKRSKRNFSQKEVNTK